MLKNYIKIAIRNLRRHTVHAAINLFGLALGLGCCILAFLFVRHELTYDAFHEDAASLYNIRSHFKEIDFSSTPDPLVPALVEAFPAITGGTRFWENETIVRHGDDLFKEKLLFADPSIFELFSFPLREGDPTTALTRPQSLVLGAEAAQKYFGDESPMGQVMALQVGEAFRDFLVTGVAEPIPTNSSIQFDFLLPFQSTYLLRDETLATAWMNYGVTSFVQLADGQDPANIEEGFSGFIEQYMGEAIRSGGDEVEVFDFDLQPLTAYYLSDDGEGDLAYIYMLGGIALLILLVACFNFMNLSIGQASSRFREIGVRKMLGARRRQLIRQFWLEAVLLSFVALLFGLMIAEMLLPVFNALAGTALTLTYAESGLLFAALGGLALFTGLAAGSYPALILSRLDTIAVFKGKLRLGGNNLLTRTLVVLQFGLSIALVVSTLIMKQQQVYMTERNLGYDKEHVVVVPTHVSRATAEQGEVVLDYFKNELSGHPQIVRIAGTSDSFNRGTTASFITKEDGTRAIVFEYRVDHDYLETLGLKLAAGRDFDPALGDDASRSLLVNEAFVRAFAEEYEMEDPIGFTLPREFGNLENPQIVGVLEDYHYQHLRTEIYPVLLTLHDAKPIEHLLVKTAPDDLPATLAMLEQTWREIRPDQPFEYHFLDEDVERQYEKEQRWSQAITYASLFAILIACLGLLGLTMITMTRRTKEIGIRKVLGASIPRIVALLSKEFLLLVAMANALAWPAAYFAMERWLQDFAFRIDIGLGPMIAAGGAALLIALLTISYLSIRAALSDPVDSLRYE